MSLIQSIFTVVDSIKVNLDVLQPLGLSLLAALTAIRLTQDGFKTVFKNEPGQGLGLNRILGYLIVSIFLISTTAYMLNAGGQEALVEWIEGFIDSAAAAVLGGQSLMDGTAFSEPFNQIDAAINDAMDRATADIEWYDFAGAILKNLMMIVLGIVAYVITFINQISFLTVLIITKMVVKVAIIIMPIFLPFAILDETKQLAYNWFSFFLECALIKLVAAVLLGISVQLLTGIVKFIPDADLGEIVTAITVVSAGQFAMFILIKRVPDIAKQLGRFR